MTREDELVVLEAGVKSDFWKLIEGKFLPRQRKMTKLLFSPGGDLQTRDRLTERLSMLDEILTWPSTRIETLNGKEEEDVHNS